VGFAGPIGLDMPIYADRDVASICDFVVGANKLDAHITGVNAGKDFEPTQWVDIRFAGEGDGCPRCESGTLKVNPGIEVGHVFKLGIKYSDAMKALFLNEMGKESPMIMGCYGIGIGRTVAAAIEQNHDENGIVFPIPVAPFEVTILPLQMHNEDVVKAASGIYEELRNMGVDVLLDDRDERAGVKFNDADLLGIPLRITIGSRGLKNGEVEVKFRSEPESFTIPFDNAAAAISDTVKGVYDSLK